MDALIDGLRQTLRDHPASVVLIVGSGVTQGAVRGTSSEAVASWVGLLESGLKHTHGIGRLDHQELETYQRLLGHSSTTSLLVAATFIERELAGGEFRLWLRNTVGRFEADLIDRSVLDVLAEYQRRGALLATTNYDTLLEHVTRLREVTWRDPSSVERAVHGDEPQVLHLHGVWRNAESIVLGMESYGDVTRDPHAQTVLATLRTARTFVFIGCGAGLRDPNLGAFLRWTGQTFSESEYRHYRLCLESEVETLRKDHPVEQRIFPLPYGRSHSDLAPFLQSLIAVETENESGKASSRGGEAAPAEVGSHVSTTHGDRLLHRLKALLRDAAPYERLQMRTLLEHVLVARKEAIAVIVELLGGSHQSILRVHRFDSHSNEEREEFIVPGSDDAHAIFALLKRHGFARELPAGFLDVPSGPLTMHFGQSAWAGIETLVQFLGSSPEHNNPGPNAVAAPAGPNPWLVVSGQTLGFPPFEFQLGPNILAAEVSWWKTLPPTLAQFSRLAGQGHLRLKGSSHQDEETLVERSKELLAKYRSPTFLLKVSEFWAPTGEPARECFLKSLQYLRPSRNPHLGALYDLAKSGGPVGSQIASAIETLFNNCVVWG
jgi:hypothetical protein